LWILSSTSALPQPLQRRLHITGSSCARGPYTPWWSTALRDHQMADRQPAV